MGTSQLLLEERGGPPCSEPSRLGQRKCNKHSPSPSSPFPRVPFQFSHTSANMAMRCVGLQRKVGWKTGCLQSHKCLKRSVHCKTTLRNDPEPEGYRRTASLRPQHEPRWDLRASGTAGRALLCGIPALPSSGPGPRTSPRLRVRSCGAHGGEALSRSTQRDRICCAARSISPSCTAALSTSDSCYPAELPPHLPPIARDGSGSERGGSSEGAIRATEVISLPRESLLSPLPASHFLQSDSVRHPPPPQDPDAASEPPPLM